MDLPNVNPGEIVRAADINKLSSGLQNLETLLLDSDTSTVTVTDNETYLTITVGD